MKICVAGAGGFVGVELVRQLLDADFKVKAVDNFYKGNRDALLHYIPNKNFEFEYDNVS